MRTTLIAELILNIVLIVWIAFGLVRIQHGQGERELLQALAVSVMLVLLEPVVLGLKGLFK